ncbi:hypothetical protein RRG08_003075 [Elysia crispata]|uniref:Uncharacterized protein n=1 Tax=Elysia crispata TaxID=231223 RepID=A0AAE1EC94_9GAST|nr:hypothetical protein RRG08_003075 [Elysia crispata]
MSRYTALSGPNCPKHLFVRKQRFDISVSLAVTDFNMGSCGTRRFIDTIGLSQGKTATELAEKASSDTTKRRRTIIRNAMAAEEQMPETEEGDPQGCHSSAETRKSAVALVGYRWPYLLSGNSLRICPKYLVRVVSTVAKTQKNMYLKSVFQSYADIYQETAESVDKAVIYSDGCYYQNRNQILTKLGQGAIKSIKPSKTKNVRRLCALTLRCLVTEEEMNGVVEATGALSPFEKATISDEWRDIPNHGPCDTYGTDAQRESNGNELKKQGSC